MALESDLQGGWFYVFKASMLLLLVLCSIHRYNDVSSQRFDDMSIDTVGPVLILWHVCSSVCTL